MARLIFCEAWLQVSLYNTSLFPATHPSDAEMWVLGLVEDVAVWDKTVQVGSLRGVSEEERARWEGVDVESG